MNNIVSVPDYKQNQATTFDRFIAFMVGFTAGFIVLFIFFKLFVLSLAGGAVLGIINIYLSGHNMMKKRIVRLRLQFFDMLEAMSVAMRAGNPLLKALKSARADLILIYSENSDIIIELDIIIARFHNAVPLSAAFSDLAERSGLEDIASFASIYATIEGKSGRADEIVKETQQIISDKMEIEMEIDTLMTAARSEVNIMLLLPVIILGVIGYAGAGFMDAIYTTGGGRIVSAGGFIVFMISYVMAQKFSSVKL